MLLPLALIASLPLAQLDAPELPIVAILPFGEVDDRTLDAVAEAIAARGRVQVRKEKARPLPGDAWYAMRKRYRAEKLLDAIDADPPKGAWKVVAVTDAEISTTKGDVADWGIGGLGNIGGRSCVVSTFLLRKHSKTRATFLRRLADLAVHEWGHTLGLDHCPVKGCVMRDAHGKLIRSIDASSGQFCEYCRVRVKAGVLQPTAQAEP